MAEVSPAEKGGGAHSPVEFSKHIKKNRISGFETSIRLLIGNAIYTFYKTSGHLECIRKHAAILDVVCLWTFF